MSYLMDTNIFIEAKNSYYAFDICPGFWDWLRRCVEVKSVSMVKEELLRGNDKLAEWIKDHLSDGFFIKEDSEIQSNYRAIANHVFSLPNFKLAEKQHFLDGADGWLVAAAMSRRDVIITHETNDKNCKRKIHIPVVAEHFNVQCQKIYDVLRALRVRFR